MTKDYRVHFYAGGRQWFTTFEQAKKAAKRRKKWIGDIYVLTADSDPTIPTNWVCVN